MTAETRDRAGRRHRRRTLRVMVEYSSVEGDRCEPATTLGAGGVFIATPEPLLESTELVLRFRLPGSDTLHEILGRVAWSRRTGEHPEHGPGMGIEFIDRDATRRLARELEEIV